MSERRSRKDGRQQGAVLHCIGRACRGREGVPGSGGAVLSGNALSLSNCNDARSSSSSQYNHPGQIVLAFNSCLEHSRYWTSLFWRPLRATNHETGASEPASSTYSHRRSIEDPSKACLDGVLKAHRSPIENPSRWRFLPGRRWRTKSACDMPAAVVNNSAWPGRVDVIL